MLSRPYLTMHNHPMLPGSRLHRLLLLALCFVTPAAFSEVAMDMTVSVEPGAEFVTVKEVISSNRSPLQYDLPEWLLSTNHEMRVLWPQNVKQADKQALTADDGKLILLYRVPAAKVLSRRNQSTWALHQPLESRLGYTGSDVIDLLQLTLLFPAGAEILEYQSATAQAHWQNMGNTLNLTATNANTVDFEIEFVYIKADPPEQRSANNANDPCSQPEADTLQALICGVQPQVTLKPLKFSSNSASLSPEARDYLDKLVPDLKQAIGPIEIAAYTDSRGPKTWNRQLSEERAYTIRLYLIYRGVAPEKLIAKGYGEEYPVMSNSTESGRAENRRVVLRRAEE